MFTDADPISRTIPGGQKDVYILIIRAKGCVTFNCKKDIAGVMKDLEREDYLRLSGGCNVIARALIERGRRGSQRHEDRVMGANECG